MKNSFYVVLNGKEKGVFYDWESCQRQVHHFKNAIFKKASSYEAALMMLNTGLPQAQEANQQGCKRSSVKRLKKICKDSAVLLTKGACAGNPGEITTKVIDLKDGREYSKSFGHGTSNLAESIALYRAVRLRSLQNATKRIFSDSSIAINRVKAGRINGQNDLSYSPHLAEYIQQANDWLKNNDLSNIFHVSEYE